MAEPLPQDPSWPRYSLRPFPRYRFVPGQSPHPRRHPQGHTFDRPDVRPAPLSPDRWRQSEPYLYGIDLYNFAYWWESHEIFEAFWHAAGRTTEQGRFFRALIQLAAANLKTFQNQRAAARALLWRGVQRLGDMPASYMGIELSLLTETILRHLAAAQTHAPLIALDVPGRSARTE